MKTTAILNLAPTISKLTTIPLRPRPGLASCRVTTLVGLTPVSSANALDDRLREDPPADLLRPDPVGDLGGLLRLVELGRGAQLDQVRAAHHDVLELTEVALVVVVLQPALADRRDAGPDVRGLERLRRQLGQLGGGDLVGGFPDFFAGSTLISPERTAWIRLSSSLASRRASSWASERSPRTTSTEATMRPRRKYDIRQVAGEDAGDRELDLPAARLVPDRGLEGGKRRRA